MPPKKQSADNQRLAQIVSEARSRREALEKTYRERALKLFPWICARCGREFSGKKLRELTVHHKDHDHNHNPPDGSNWELLCLYCHENEHDRMSVAESYDHHAPDQDLPSDFGNKPLAGLAELLKKNKTE